MVRMQVDSVAMESLLGPVLADIFMIELGKGILPELTECIKNWKRYVDGTISFVKLGTINHIIAKLKSFDNNIRFTFEEEEKGTLPFLDVLICRKGNSIVTNVFRKPTNNDIYLNKNASEPDIWKRGILKTLVEKELKCFEKVFHETNNYPQHIIK